MATTAGATIKQGDANITAAVREFWDQDIQKRIYDMVLSRNLEGAVVWRTDYRQGVNNEFKWTRSQGITTATATRYDIGVNDLELQQVEYGTEELSVSAAPKGGYVAQKLDILRDQEGFVMPDIMDSLAEDMAKIEDTAFLNVVDTNATVVYAPVDAVALNLLSLKQGGVTPIESNNLTFRYYLMNPKTVDLFGDELRPANTTGDNTFLRNNVVGSLWGGQVVKTNKVAEGIVYYLANDAVRAFEREPYTMNFARDNVSDYYVKFAIQARFGFNKDRTGAIQKSTFNTA